MDDITPSLLISNLPDKALAGIDLLSFTTTPKFHGVKAIPPGLHFTFTAPHSTLALRHGAWFIIRPVVQFENAGPQIVIKRWDENGETLVSERRDGELLKARANLGTIWQNGMISYRQDVGQQDEEIENGGSKRDNTWTGLSSYITQAYLNKVFGSTEGNDWYLTSFTDASGGQDDDGLPATKQIETSLRLMSIDLKRTWPVEATGRERTDCARDRSWYLFDLERQYTVGSDDSNSVVLAEFQFCFLMTLTLNNFTCLEQWRKLIRLVFTCTKGVIERPEFFVQFLDILQAQILRLSASATNNIQNTSPHSVNTTKPSVQTSIEDKSEAELLQYDIPFRAKPNADFRGKSREKQANQEEISREEDNDDLITLFLEDVDSNPNASNFLKELIIKFRNEIRSTYINSDSNSTVSNNTAIRPVLKALSELEATLFEQLAWEFDEQDIHRGFKSEKTQSNVYIRNLRELQDGDEPDATTYKPLGGAKHISGFVEEINSDDEVEHNSAKSIDGGKAERKGAMRYDYDNDDDDDDDDDEFAPTVVELTPQQMRDLGLNVDMKGHDITTGKKDVINRDTHSQETKSNNELEYYEIVDLDDMDERF